MNVNSTWGKIRDLMIQAKNNDDFIKLVKEYDPQLVEYVKDFDLSKAEKDSEGNLCLTYQFGRIFKRRLLKGETIC